MGTLNQSVAGQYNNQLALSESFSALVAEVNSKTRAYAQSFIGAEAPVAFKPEGDLEKSLRDKLDLYYRGLILMALEAVIGDDKVTFDGCARAARKVYGSFVHAPFGDFRRAAKVIKPATKSDKALKSWYDSMKHWDEVRVDMEFIIKEFSLSTTPEEFVEYEKTLQQRKYDDLCDRLIGLLVAKIVK